MRQLYAKKNTQIVKAFLETFVEETRASKQRDEFRGLNFAQEWAGFFDALSMAEGINEVLSEDNVEYIKLLAEKARVRIQDAISAVQNADPT